MYGVRHLLRQAGPSRFCYLYSHGAYPDNALFRNQWGHYHSTLFR